LSPWELALTKKGQADRIGPTRPEAGKRLSFETGYPERSPDGLGGISMTNWFINSSAVGLRSPKIMLI
jgi:hypothetical protein